MTTKTAIKISDDVFYEVVRELSGGAELRRYTFFDWSVHSVIFVDGSIKEAVPIEREDYLVAWWETECENKRHEEVNNENKTDDI